MMDTKERKIRVKDLNSAITCRLCEGYLIDATALTECLHVFCRACILRYFENSKTGCPTCNTVYKKKSQTCFRSDPQTQYLVYKLVPSLFAKESQRREDFYRSTGVRASSSCSDDSVIDRERDMINDHEETVSNYFGDKTQFLSPEDSISLSLEYYQVHLDTTDVNEKLKPRPFVFENIENICKENTDPCIVPTTNSDSVKSTDNDETVKTENDNRKCDKRFLQCPAAVTMKHLQKFIRMKFGLTADHRVDIIYKGEVLKTDFSLMDVAYTFTWKREKPMRFFYRIFTPQKIRPIKILLGGEQLQIVPVKATTTEIQKSPPPLPPQPPPSSTPPPKEDKCDVKVEVKDNFLEETEDQKNHKARLFAHLQLKSKTQVEKEIKKVPEKTLQKDCVFEYQEPDQEEIKRFAEIRDREWALKLNEERRKQEEEYSTHHVSKKRKKSKHSKNESNTHKKRKLHAEIASNEEALKLKVKITTNGHKHKHHKNSVQFNDKEKMYMSELSSKEKLLHLRQVRHKQFPSEDKNVQTVPSLILSKDAKPQNGDQKPILAKPADDIKKLKIKVSESSNTEPSTKVTESAILPKPRTEPISTSPKVGTFVESGSPSKQGFINAGASNEWGKKIPTVQLERNEQTEKQAQNAQFLKTYHAFAEKYHRNEKMQQNKMESAKQMTQIKTEPNKITTNNKSLDLKIANLQQRCTIETKQPDKEKKVTFSKTNNKILTHYPPGVTVSKVEQGVKRKHEEKDLNKCSLEITLINPPQNVSTVQRSNEKLPVKRPLPATIPLEKIKKSVNLKSGITIIPKIPERCDNIGALDLSNKSPEPSPRNSPKIESTNGVTISTNRQLNALSRTEKNNTGLSNLQMLSKVATEHPILNNKLTQNNKPTTILNKTSAPIPNLQTLKIPNLQNSVMIKKIPKLNEIQKFRPTGTQIRRPNQNIRNIPNPSALIRQQNQNRLNISTTQTQTQTSASTSSTSTPISAVKTIDIKVQEKKEISV